MNDSITLVINPLKRVIHPSRGANLFDAFLAEGMEIAALCNRNGSCGKCRVVVKAESNPPTSIERLSLGELLINEGYRLACKTEIHGSGEVFIPLESCEDLLENTYFGNELITIKNRNFPYPIRQTSSPVQFKTRYYVAIDIGTTTLTGYMFDGKGNLLSHCSFFNPTTLFGCDVITRLACLQTGEDDFRKMRQSLLTGLRRLLNTLCFRAKGKASGVASQNISPERICKIAVCGNTVMQHIFFGINPVEIGLFPYRPIVRNLLKTKALNLMDYAELGLTENSEIVVAPSVSGFIGGDAVCGVLMTQLHRSPEPCLFIDLGTNGEMILNYRGNLFAASASAGPAFEGYSIPSGMRATVGAIDLVRIDEGYNISYSVIGGGKPKGICGTGTISAVAAMLKAGVLREKGHIIPQIFAKGRIRENSLIIATENETSTGKPVVLTGKDVGVIQQAKAAFASGITCLLHAAGLESEGLEKIFIAGAFGSRVDVESLKIIGLIPYDINAEVVSTGNAAGAGVAMILLCEDAEREAAAIADVVKTVEFASMKEFEDEFLKALFFRTNAVCYG